MTLYTDTVKTFAKNLKAPYHGIMWDVVEYNDPDYLAIRLYRDNLAEYSEPQLTSITEWAGQLIGGIRKMGIPCYLEAVERP